MARIATLCNSFEYFAKYYIMDFFSLKQTNDVIFLLQDSLARGIPKFRLISPSAKSRRENIPGLLI